MDFPHDVLVDLQRLSYKIKTTLISYRYHTTESPRGSEMVGEWGQAGDNTTLYNTLLISSVFHNTYKHCIICHYRPLVPNSPTTKATK